MSPVRAVADMMIYPTPQTPWKGCSVRVFSMGLLCPPRPCHPTHSVTSRGGLIELQQISSLPTAPSRLSRALRASTQRGEKGHCSPSVNTIKTCHGTSNEILLKMIASVELPIRKKPRITQ